MMKSKIYMITAMLIFGSLGLFIRGIPLPSTQIALLRGIAGSVFLLLTCFILRKKPSWKAVKPNFILLLISGAAIGFNWILLFQAYKYTTISKATLSYYFAPVFVVLLSPFILKEPLNKLKIFCIIAAMTGMFLISGIGNGGNTSNNRIIGIIFGLSAAVLYASVVIINKFIKNLNGLETTLIQLSAASLVLLPYDMITEKFDFTAMNSKAVILLAVVGFIHTGFAYLLYFTSLQQLNGQTAAVFSYVDPITAIVLSAVFLGEKMSVVQFIGGVLILGAAFLSGRAKETKNSLRRAETVNLKE